MNLLLRKFWPFLPNQNYNFLKNEDRSQKPLLVFNHRLEIKETQTNKLPFYASFINL